MHVTEEVDVAEVPGVISRLVLTKVVPEEYVQLVSLSDNDQAHISRSLTSNDLNDLVHSTGHGGIKSFQASFINVNLGSTANAEDLTDLGNEMGKFKNQRKKRSEEIFRNISNVG